MVSYNDQPEITDVISFNCYSLNIPFYCSWIEVLEGSLSNADFVVFEEFVSCLFQSEGFIFIGTLECGWCRFDMLLFVAEAQTVCFIDALNNILNGLTWQFFNPSIVGSFLQFGYMILKINSRQIFPIPLIISLVSTDTLVVQSAKAI